MIAGITYPYLRALLQERFCHVTYMRETECGVQETTLRMGSETRRATISATHLLPVLLSLGNNHACAILSANSGSLQDMAALTFTKESYRSPTSQR